MSVSCSLDDEYQQRFCWNPQSIIADTEGELNDLLSLQDKSTSEFHETVKFFGEKPSTATTEDFFGIFAAFIMNFEVSYPWSLTGKKFGEFSFFISTKSCVVFVSSL